MITILKGVTTLKPGDVEDSYANHTILGFLLKGNKIYLPFNNAFKIVNYYFCNCWK